MAARGQWFAVAAIVAVLVGALAAGVALSPELRPVRPGSDAPDFEAVNLTTGQTVALADYSGQVVLLNLWATWCPPCEREMPSMQRLHEQLGPEGLRVVAVSVDATDSDAVLAWAQERDLTFDVLHHRDGRVERLYQTTGLPESFIIDRDGLIVKKEIGAREWDSPAQTAFFLRLLEQEGDSRE
jgi:peroxiredoxin